MYTLYGKQTQASSQCLVLMSCGLVQYFPQAKAPRTFVSKFFFVFFSFAAHFVPSFLKQQICIQQLKKLSVGNEICSCSHKFVYLILLSNALSYGILVYMFDHLVCVTRILTASSCVIFDIRSFRSFRQTWLDRMTSQDEGHFIWRWIAPLDG